MTLVAFLPGAVESGRYGVDKAVNDVIWKDTQLVSRAGVAHDAWVASRWREHLPNKGGDMCRDSSWWMGELGCGEASQCGRLRAERAMSVACDGGCVVQRRGDRGRRVGRGVGRWEA